MIHGIGVDICDSTRIHDLHEKYREKFLKRVFIAPEIEYCLSKSNPAPYLAARFAFKEAFFKALSPNFEISFQDIGLSGKEGKKNVVTSDHLTKILENMNVRNIQFSISHEKHYSIAMVLLEKP